MKLIDGDKLIHTDNSEDVLQHFGVKGMKWGLDHRYAKASKAYNDYMKGN